MAEYALALSPEELERYHFMAGLAKASEAGDWAAAGIRPGAAVVDIGCGPGAVLRLLAEEVGAGGRAVGVDLDPEAVTAARAAVTDLPQAEVKQGTATATGLDPGSFEVAMCRHVLAHNGTAEAALVTHLAELTRAGGAVYLVDTDLTGARIRPTVPELYDLIDRYVEFQEQRGNDMTVGASLGILLAGAGLDVERFRFGGPVLRAPLGMRGPAWAARDAMLAAGVVSWDDIARWSRGFAKLDTEEYRPWLTMPVFVAIGRRAG